MQPYQSYMICGTPRSGSTLLCGLLESAGCGRPGSYFRQESIAHLAQDLGVSHDNDLSSRDFNRRYLDAVLTEGRAGTSVFGLRVMFETLQTLSDRLDLLFPGLENTPRRFERAFGRTLYIHLSRDDKVAQAVSRLKAEQTGLWHRAPDGSELERTAPHSEAVFDAKAIGALVEQLEHDDKAWRDWFAVHRIEPVSLTYEGLARDPQAGLRAVLVGLGADVALASDVMPATAKLADTQTEDWIRRFRAIQK